MDISHRKVSKKIRFLDAQGNPISHQEIAVKQKNHKFLFGCGAFDFLSYVMMSTDDQWSGLGGTSLGGAPWGGKEQLKNITDSWLEIFNYGTLPFYWGMFEKEEGKPDTEKIMKTAEYLKSKGVTVKGHPLCWHTACADWLLKYDNATIMDKQLARIDREVGGFKGVIDMWDVINEVVIMPVFDKYDNAIV